MDPSSKVLTLYGEREMVREDGAGAERHVERHFGVFIRHVQVRAGHIGHIALPGLRCHGESNHADPCMVDVEISNTCPAASCATHSVQEAVIEHSNCCHGACSFRRMLIWTTSQRRLRMGNSLCACLEPQRSKRAVRP